MDALHLQVHVEVVRQQVDLPTLLPDVHLPLLDAAIGLIKRSGIPPGSPQQAGKKYIIRLCYQVTSSLFITKPINK